MESDKKEENEEEKLKHIRYLNEHYPIEARYCKLLIQIQDLLEAAKIMDYVRVDEKLLGYAVLDYFEDIDRLKDFEGIERTNVAKIYGYETFWLLRDKPIQITSSEIPWEFLFINEKIFAVILFAKMLRAAGAGPDSKSAQLLPLLKLMYYNFRYRQFTQKSLELMVSAFLCGCKLTISVSEADREGGKSDI